MNAGGDSVEVCQDVLDSRERIMTGSGFEDRRGYIHLAGRDPSSAMVAMIQKPATFMTRWPSLEGLKRNSSHPSIAVPVNIRGMQRIEAKLPESTLPFIQLNISHPTSSVRPAMTHIVLVSHSDLVLVSRPNSTVL